MPEHGTFTQRPDMFRPARNTAGIWSSTWTGNIQYNVTITIQYNYKRKTGWMNMVSVSHLSSTCITCLIDSTLLWCVCSAGWPAASWEYRRWIEIQTVLLLQDQSLQAKKWCQNPGIFYNGLALYTFKTADIDVDAFLNRTNVNEKRTPDCDRETLSRKVSRNLL
jgi:hypothetical protein